MSLWNVYIGGVTEDVWNYHPRPNTDTTIPARGIEHFLFDDFDGSLTHKGTTEGDLFSPQSLARHPAQPVLYAAEFAHPGRLVSFTIRHDGSLDRQSTAQTHGAMAISVALHPNATLAYVGHLGDGVISVCRLGLAGEITDSDPVVVPTEGRCGTKIHHVRVTPDARALIATDFGRDEVATYPLSPGGDILPEPVARVTFPRGSSPRQVELHPSGKYAYAVGVGDSHLYVLEAENYVPRRIVDRHPLAPAGVKGKPAAAETSLHPDGNTLYVGVRGVDSIVAFTLDEAGRAVYRYIVPSEGRSPRSVELDPSGKYLFVGNWHSNRILVFAVTDTGHLLPVGDGVDVPSPSSIIFAPTFDRSEQ